jgi:hypothetical protein
VAAACAIAKPPAGTEGRQKEPLSVPATTTAGSGDPYGQWAVRPASAVPREQVAWVWPGRVPAGKLTVIEGDPATAKSTMTLDLAARVIIGSSWPDGAPGGPPAPVLLLSAEDGWGDTVRPRLEAAGADLERCLCVAAREVEAEHGTLFRPVVLPEDITWLMGLVERSGAAMVVLDVLAAHLSDRVDSHKDQSVRRLLATLGAAAARSGVAVLLVRHHNKAPGAPPCTGAVARSGSWGRPGPPTPWCATPTTPSTGCWPPSSPTWP